MDSAREFDVVILGASGFTGKYVVAEALKSLSAPNSPLKTLALAGRNPGKISKSLAWASAWASLPPPASPIPILTADVTSPSSLLALARRARVLLNCVGPFCLYGAPVVAACVEAGTDYFDLSAEPGFMERIEAEHHAAAVKTGSLVISACAFDHVVAELGLIFNSRQWVGPAAPHSVEAFLVLESDKRIVFGSFESAVLGAPDAVALHDNPRSRPSIPGPPHSEGSLVERQKSLGIWGVKRPAADAFYIGRTWAALAENQGGLPGVEESEHYTGKRENYWSSVKPAHFSMRIGLKSLLGVVRVMLAGIFMGTLGAFSWGRSLLTKFPEFFSLGWYSKTGPTEEEVRSTTFKMWFVGRGFSDASIASKGSRPDREIITRVSGPEVGYITTPLIMLQCALIALGQRQNLPKGGVFPPGIVFGPTGLQERLQENGVSFELISKRDLSQ